MLTPRTCSNLLRHALHSRRKQAILSQTVVRIHHTDNRNPFGADRPVLEKEIVTKTVNGPGSERFPGPKIARSARRSALRLAPTSAMKSTASKTPRRNHRRLGRGAALFQPALASVTDAEVAHSTMVRIGQFLGPNAFPPTAPVLQLTRTRRKRI